MAASDQGRAVTTLKRMTNTDVSSIDFVTIGLATLKPHGVRGVDPRS